MKLGIVGLPNVGKSTLFNSLTKASAYIANYPFCTIEPNKGIVKVPDNRLYELKKLYNSESIVKATIEFIDIAGIVKGASKGEGLGNKFLANIREVDAILHVVRCFEDENIIHVHNAIDPLDDIETINLELILSDLEMVDNKLIKMKKNKQDKSGDKDLDILMLVKHTLEQGKRAGIILDEDNKDFINSLNLLTTKPVLYVDNVLEKDLQIEDMHINNKHVQAVYKLAKEEKSELICISAKIEEELSRLEDEEKRLFLKELGMDDSGLDKIIIAGYRLLGLISFLTAGPKEVRAWTINKGLSAQLAAAKIHSDIQRGFIRAETVSYNELINIGGYQQAREKGLIRLEGKDYIVEDGDVILFRFNV